MLGDVVLASWRWQLAAKYTEAPKQVYDGNEEMRKYFWMVH